MTNNRFVLVIYVTIALLTSGLGFAYVAIGNAKPETETPLPRVCWYSDYARAKLSNQCQYRNDERRWYMMVQGVMHPADLQQLPVANLCHYFYGTECPK